MSVDGTYELQYPGSVGPGALFFILSYPYKFNSKEMQLKTDTRTQVEYHLSLTPGTGT